MVGKGRATPDGWVLPGYEHIRELGSGAGGRVWLARHRVTGTLVAVKYLVPGLHAAADFREAYRAEAQLLAELRSPYVARLYEYVEGPPGAAIVMEAVEGCSLRALMKSEDTATSPEAALCILKGSLLGLAAAHAAGVVHRDYKPANVLVRPDGLSKLVDFGIAARTGSAAVPAGTPNYMAPEQFHGAPASPATDVYAATVTFFECVTGERPFPGTNAIELMAQHALGVIPDDLAPPPVRSLVRKGMAKDPRERPASAREFLARLESVAGAAYGPDWERRGQHKLATLLALTPLFLLLSQAVPTTPAGATSVATTFLGGEPITLTAAPGSAGQQARGRSGRARRIPKHATRLSISAGILGVLMVMAGAAVAAYAATGHNSSQSMRTNSVALTSATTKVTADSTVPVTLAPPPSAGTSATGSLTPSASTSASASLTSTASLALSPSSASTPPPSASSVAPTSRAATTNPPPIPAIDSLAITQLSCPSTDLLQASVAVTSNGQGGTLTLSWFYESVTGAQQFATTTYDLTAGQTSQTVSPPAEDFSQYEDYSAWGVTISSTPAVNPGSNATDTIDPGTSGCLPVS
jgi:eukaryotic-like serine/threonine-protein kinase